MTITQKITDMNDRKADIRSDFQRNRGKQLRLSREYRGVSKAELVKNIDDVSLLYISNFEDGYNSLSDEKIDEIMKYLNFPLSFLDKRHQELGRVFMCDID